MNFSQVLENCSILGWLYVPFRSETSLDNNHAFENYSCCMYHTDSDLLHLAFVFVLALVSCMYHTDSDLLHQVLHE